MSSRLLSAARWAVLTGLRGTKKGLVGLWLRRASTRRLRLIAAAAAVVLVGFMLTVAAAAELPVMVADTVTGWLFGGRTDSSERSAPQICFPSPAAAAGGPTGGAAGVPVIIDEQGRPSAAARAVIDAIPVGVPVDTAQGWVLFRLTHNPGEGAPGDFASFATVFSSMAGELSPGASPVDVVSSMDPRADYSSVLLLAQAASYQLLRQGSVSYTPQQREDTIAALSATCEGLGRQRR